MDSQKVHLETVNNLKITKKWVIIQYPEQLDEYRSEIEYRELKEQRYQIVVNFNRCDSSQQFKTDVINMLDQLQVNDKVSQLMIKVHQDNSISPETMQQIKDKLNNVYFIMIVDHSDQINNDVHQNMLEMVDKLCLFDFRVGFNNGLKESEESAKLIQQYNMKLKKQVSLCNLYYYHSKINKTASKAENVRFMVENLNIS